MNQPTLEEELRKAHEQIDDLHLQLVMRDVYLVNSGRYAHFLDQEPLARRFSDERLAVINALGEALEKLRDNSTCSDITILAEAAGALGRWKAGSRVKALHAKSKEENDSDA